MQQTPQKKLNTGRGNNVTVPRKTSNNHNNEFFGFTKIVVLDIN